MKSNLLATQTTINTTQTKLTQTTKDIGTANAAIADLITKNKVLSAGIDTNDETIKNLQNSITSLNVQGADAAATQKTYQDAAVNNLKDLQTALNLLNLEYTADAQRLNAAFLALQTATSPDIFIATITGLLP